MVDFIVRSCLIISKYYAVKIRKYTLFLFSPISTLLAHAIKAKTPDNHYFIRSFTYPCLSYSQTNSCMT
jgi:hypothetical protein